MARFRRLIHSVASGYIALAGSALYALATIPLALHYLSKERFALWALLATIAGYFSLIDLGMSGAVARLLIDHKDERQTGAYGSLLKTGWLVLICQAALILLAGLLLAPAITGLLDMPGELHDEFVALLRWQTGIVAFSFLARMFTHLLQAHQRNDIINYSQVIGLVLNFSLLWWFFHHGHGVFSLIWATFLSAILSALLLAIACSKLQLLPSRGQWGRCSWTYFKEMFGYGKDLFLVAVGTQLILASQTIIIKRRLGLEAVAAWAVGIRTFNLLCQAIWRIMLFSTPALSEMIVRNEHARVRERFRDILILSASMSAFVAITFAACNSSFVEFWTTSRKNAPIPWPSVNDLLLGCWMILLSLVNCHNNFVLTTKRVGFMRYVYFIEGCVFVAIAWVVTGKAGVPGLIACSVLCTCLFTYSYGVWRTSAYFNTSFAEVTGTWLTPMATVLLFMAPPVAITYFAVRSFPAPARLLALCFVCGTLGVAILLRFGLPATLRQELAERSPKRLSPFLRLLLRVAPDGRSTP